MICIFLSLIRCDPNKLELRKSQKTTIKIVRNYLENNEKKLPRKNESTKQESQVLKFKNDYIKNRINQTENTNAKKIIDFFSSFNSKKIYFQISFIKKN